MTAFAKLKLNPDAVEQVLVIVCAVGIISSQQQCLRHMLGHVHTRRQRIADLIRRYGYHLPVNLAFSFFYVTIKKERGTNDSSLRLVQQ